MIVLEILKSTASDACIQVPMWSVQFCVSNGQIEKSAKQRALCTQGGIQDTWPLDAIRQLASLHESTWTDAMSLVIAMLYYSKMNDKPRTIPVEHL